MDELDSDLGDLEEAVFEDEDDEEDEDDACSCGCAHSHSDDDEDEEEEADEDEEDEGALDFIEYECPHCGASIYYDQSAFDLSEAHPCPSCGKELFPETPDEDE